MKKLSVFLGAVVAIVFSAQALAGSEIGVVNVGQILRDSPKVEAASKAIQDQFAERQATIKSEQDALQASMEKLKKDSAVMKPEDKKKLEGEIDGQRKKILADIAQFQKELSEAQSASMKTVFDGLNKVVKDVADEKDLSVVIDSQFVVYADDNQDITSKVAKIFNDKK